MEVKTCRASFDKFAQLPVHEAVNKKMLDSFTDLENSIMNTKYLREYLTRWMWFLNGTVGLRYIPHSLFDFKKQIKCGNTDMVASHESVSFRSLDTTDSLS